MNMTKGALAGIAAASLMTLTACGSDNSTKSTNTAASGSSGGSDCAKGSLSGSGSTFQQNIEAQWIKDFGASCSGAQINYTGTGSSTGISQFGSGTINYAGSDAVMKPDEQTKADTACGSKAIHIPVTAGGVAIMYNVKGVTNLQLSAKTLAGIFQGTIKKWNDPAIAAENAGTKLPATPVTAYHRSDGSGTTKVFSGFEMDNAGAAWKLGSDKSLNWPAGGQAAKGSDGVSAGVKQTDGGVTYVEISFAKADALPTAKVKGSGSAYTGISATTVGDFLASSFSTTGSGNDLAGKLDFKGTSGYPISTVSYVIVCQKAKDAAKGKLLKAFLTYAVGAGQGTADSLGFAPLPASIATKAKAAVASLS